MKLLSIAILTMLSFAAFGQSKKGSFSINLGFHLTNSYQKLFYNSEGVELMYPTKQTSAVFPDVNLLYARQIKHSKLKIVFGVGANQKGLNENGMESDGSANLYPYAEEFRKTYFSIYGGFNYDLLSYKKIKIILGQLLNPEINFDDEGLYKKIPLATRTNLIVSWKASKGASLLLTLYYQTALTTYNKVKLNPVSSNYLPYGFGLNLGVAFGQ